jgi:pimeloyl-ACP methyl ester carboxylesterase
MPSFFDNPLDRGYIKSFDGLQIYWEHHGTKITANSEPILFCYGLACSKLQWRSLAEQFTKDHPCIFFDYRGHHKSEFVPTEHRLNMSHLSRDAAFVLEHLNIKKTHVFAHSMGCNVSLELCFQEPSLVLSQVLIAGSAENPFQSMLGMNILDKVVNPLLESFSSNKDNFYKVWKWILKNRAILRLVVMTAGFKRKAVESHDIESYLDSIASVSPHVFFELLRDLALGKSESLLPRIQAPTLVVSGADDQVTPPEVQRRLAAGIRHSEYFSIPLGSHNVQLEFGDYLSMKIRDFWSKSLPKPDIKKKREKKSNRN